MRRHRKTQPDPAVTHPEHARIHYEREPGCLGVVRGRWTHHTVLEPWRPHHASDTDVLT